MDLAHTPSIDYLLSKSDNYLCDLFLKEVDIKHFFFLAEAHPRFECIASLILPNKEFSIDPRFVQLCQLEHTMEKCGKHIRKINITHDMGFNIIIPLIDIYCENIEEFTCKFYNVDPLPDNIQNIFKRVNKLALETDSNIERMIPQDCKFESFSATLCTGALPPHRLEQMTDVELNLCEMSCHSTVAKFLRSNTQIEKITIHSPLIDIHPMVSYMNLQELHIDKCSKMLCQREFHMVAKNVKKLCISNTDAELTSNLLESIAIKNIQVETLFLGKVHDLDNDSIDHITQFTSLKVLFICNIQTGQLMTILRACKQMRELYLVEQGFTIADIETIISENTSVKIFHFIIGSIAVVENKPICVKTVENINGIREARDIHIQLNLWGYPPNLPGMQEALRYEWITRA